MSFKKFMRRGVAIHLIATAFACSEVGPYAAGPDSLRIDKPALHHILLEVGDCAASIRFYRDVLGLSLTSNKNGFATLESANAGVYLWENRQGWEKPFAPGDRRGAGIYPHFEVGDVASAITRFRNAGYKIVQEPRTYDWGVEAFVRDPDGYVIALVSMKKK